MLAGHLDGPITAEEDVLHRGKDGELVRDYFSTFLQSVIFVGGLRRRGRKFA